MSAQAGHDLHSIRVDQLLLVCAAMSEDAKAITAIPRDMVNYPGCGVALDGLKVRPAVRL